MSVKELILIPIYWGEWWVTTQTNGYNWSDVNAPMARVIGGRYMDGLNQYGFGRGAVSKTHVHGVDPPPGRLGVADQQWILRTAIEAGEVAKPTEFDLAGQWPLYSLILPPDLHDTVADSALFEFTYATGQGQETWSGQACWIRADVAAPGTVRRWVRRLAEACTLGHGDIAGHCLGDSPVFVDRVSVPQYWSVLDNSCWPTPDVAPVERRSQHAIDQETQRELDAQFERQHHGAGQVEARVGLHRREDD